MAIPALFCLLVNTSLNQNTPSVIAYSPTATILPDITNATLISNALEGELCNMSFLGRSSRLNSQPFSIVKTSYQNGLWRQTILPLPQTINPINAGLKWAQDPDGNMWVIQNQMKGGTAGNTALTNLFYISPLTESTTIYNGTQFTLVDIQIAPQAFYILASFANAGPTSLLTYGILAMNPPKDFLPNFQWLPGTQRSTPIQTFLFPRDPINDFYIVGNTGAFETWQKNMTTNSWFLFKTTPLSILGPVLKIQEGLLRNSFFCISAKTLLQIVFQPDETVTQTILQSYTPTSPISFRSIGLGMIEQTTVSFTATGVSTQNPTPSQLNTRSSVPSQRPTFTSIGTKSQTQISSTSSVMTQPNTQDSTQSAVSTYTQTQSSVSTSTSTQSSVSTSISTQSAVPTSTSIQSFGSTLLSTQSAVSTYTQTQSSFMLPESTQSSSTSPEYTQSAQYSQSETSTKTPFSPGNQTQSNSVGMESYVMPLSAGLGVGAIVLASLFVMKKKLLSKKLFRKEQAPKKIVYRDIELPTNRDLIFHKVTYEPENWDKNSAHRFPKPAKASFQPKNVTM